MIATAACVFMSIKGGPPDLLHKDPFLFGVIEIVETKALGLIE